ncbi:MAG: 4Fe-4S dicluster domain-containing protein, partial [Planctomycetota bacterium]
AMAETLGDTQRHKMPHGPFWNRLNMVGQVLLVFALALMGLRALGWMGVGWASSWFSWLSSDAPIISYAWFVDLLLAGAVGYGVYFWLSGRVWCRFACPLAALMHIYARIGRFAILADKKKCISCNVCTSVCHQGIDIMSFANKGKPMKDPECVRCSACVQMCPTGVLTFGQTDRDGNTISKDPAWLAASPVQMVESSRLTVNGGAQGKH